ncbi:MAG TPA: NAD-dependent epimerase/dehydratase family protein, partial [Actinomycetota bacterium]
CRAFWQVYGLETVALRYFNVFGPRQDPQSQYAAVVPRFITACLTGARPVIHGDGEQSRDFAFVDDVVEANVLASRASDAALGRAFNVGGGGTPTSVNALLATVAELTGATPDPIHEPAREGDMRATQADLTRVKHALGLEPSVDIREGLRRTVEWFSKEAA